jgi:hypothetical protein
MTEHINLKALKEAAEKATPGPWTPEGRSTASYVRSPGQVRTHHIAQCNAWDHPAAHNGPAPSRGQAYSNAAFIAATDPQTILALVAVVEAARNVFKCDGRMVSLEGGPTEWRALHDALHPFTEST